MKTGFGLVNETSPEPLFRVFRAKIPRTFWGKCTEQSSRKKLAEGGFEPRSARTLGEKHRNLRRTGAVKYCNLTNAVLYFFL